MPMQAQEIEDLIRETFPQAKITITDLAGDGNHYAAEVIDESFRDQNRVQQQTQARKPKYRLGQYHFHRQPHELT